MSTPVAPSYDLKNGQLRNVLLATFISTIGFWAWTIVGPLAKICLLYTSPSPRD